MSDSRSDLRVSPGKIVRGHAEIASTLSLKRRPRYAETCGLEHARAWRRPRPCRLPEVRLHGNRLQASTACVVPIRVPIWQPGMRQLTSSSPPTSWRLCAPRSTLRPAVPLSRCPAVPLSRDPAAFRPTTLRATPAQPWSSTQSCGCANGCTGNSIGSYLSNLRNVMNHCNRARPASPALQRLRAARRHSCRDRKLRLLQDIVQTLRNAGLMDHDPLTPDEEVRRARGAGN